MNQFAEQREQWINQFKSYSDEALVKTFYGNVGLKTFGVLLSIYLNTLEQEIISRGWDYSEIISICPKTNSLLSVSYAFPVELIGNKLVPIKNYFWFNKLKVYIN